MVACLDIVEEKREDLGELKFDIRDMLADRSVGCCVRSSGINMDLDRCRCNVNQTSVSYL